MVRSHLEYGADTAGAIGQNFLSWSGNGRLNLAGALSIVDTDLDGLPDSDRGQTTIFSQRNCRSSGI